VTSSRLFTRIIVCAALLLVSGLANCQEKTLPVKAAPFTLAGLDGKPVSLSDHSGKVILLDFWATWCVPCQTEVPRFVAFQNEYGKQGFQVIGISMDDTPVPVRKFYAKYKMNYPVAMGTTKVAEAYGGVLGLPLTFLISKDGRIVKLYDASADFAQMEAEIKSLLKQGNATK
jgi:cytochrome c biogenesis protein CcmG/thiol:disulfide interchange protein DsbE